MNAINVSNTTPAASTGCIKELPDSFRFFHRGVFSGIAIESDTKSESEFIRLKVTVTLEAKDSKGVPFIAEKTYNFHPDGHGRNAVVKDYQAWTGKKLTNADLWVFDPRKFTIGKPVSVEVEVRGGRGAYRLYIKKFRPPTTPTAR